LIAPPLDPTLNDCEPGFDPPTVKANFNELGFAVTFGLVAAVTVRDTGTLCGVFPASDDAIETLPLYVPAARPDGFTDTLTLPGVLPLPVADNQLPPDADAE
jgi:hypothetical protein